MSNNPLKGFLLDLAANPDDDGVRCIFADWLEEQGPPSPVRLHHFPNWLRRAWLQANRGGRLIRHARPYITRAGEVFDELQSWLDTQPGAPHFPATFDHWGSSTIGSHLCLVNEPYAACQDAVRYLLPLARELRCPCAFARQGAWPQRTSRILLFPVVTPTARERNAD